MNEIPRRAYLDKMVPAERAIHDAIQAVEAMGADVRLTDVVVRLGAAKDALSDYVDAQAKAAFHQGTVAAIAEYVEHLRDDFASSTDPVKKVARFIRERFGAASAERG